MTTHSNPIYTNKTKIENRIFTFADIGNFWELEHTHNRTESRSTAISNQLQNSPLKAEKYDAPTRCTDLRCKHLQTSLFIQFFFCLEIGFFHKKIISSSQHNIGGCTRRLKPSIFNQLEFVYTLGTPIQITNRLYILVKKFFTFSVK